MVNTAGGIAPEIIVAAEAFCRTFTKQKSNQHFFFRCLLERYQADPSGVCGYEAIHEYIRARFGRNQSHYEEDRDKQPIIDLCHRVQERLEEFCHGQPACLSIENVPNEGYRLVALPSPEAADGPVSTPPPDRSPQAAPWLPYAMVGAFVVVAAVVVIVRAFRQPGPASSGTRGPAPMMSPAPKAWAETIGGTSWDGFNALVEVPDGSYVLAGATESSGAGQRDVWLVNLDPAGRVLWQKTYGGPMDDEANSLAATSDGGLIVAGYTKSFGAGGKDAYVLKLGSAGGVEWQKAIGGPADDEAFSVKQTPDGGYILAGETRSFGVSVSQPDWKQRSDAWLLKLAPDGRVVWQKTYGTPLRDSATAVAEDDIGDFAVAGLTYRHEIGEERIEAIVPDGWMLLVATDGRLVGQSSIGGSGLDAFNALVQTRNERFVFAGNANFLGYLGKDEQFDDFWIVKVEETVNKGFDVVEWQKKYGTISSDEIQAIDQTADGGFVLAGNTATKRTGPDADQKIYDAWIMKVNEQGERVWSRRFGYPGDDRVFSVIQAKDGSFVVAGTTFSVGAGSADGWVLKLGPDGMIGPNCAGNGKMGEPLDRPAHDTTKYTTFRKTDAVVADSHADEKPAPGVAADSAASVAVQCHSP